MNIGSSAADIGLVVLLLFPALLAPVLLIGVGLLIGRVLRLPGVFAALFALALIGALLVGGSLYLDSAGQVVPALVEQRSESVALRSQGDWRHRLSVQVRYNLNGTALSPASPRSTTAPPRYARCRRSSTACARASRRSCGCCRCFGAWPWCGSPTAARATISPGSGSALLLACCCCSGWRG